MKSEIYSYFSLEEYSKNACLTNQHTNSNTQTYSQKDFYSFLS